jgi:cilia- and flagella-associated protein 300
LKLKFFKYFLDIVSAARDTNTKEIIIRSIALQITDIENSNLYRIKNHPQNFFYVIIDPYQRHVHLWYHKWVSFW